MKIPRVQTPRLTYWLIVSVVLAVLAYQSRQHETLLAVTLYKAHLMSLGGWGGYWLDRVLFPYARPHIFLDQLTCAAPGEPTFLSPGGECSIDPLPPVLLFCLVTLRRAVIVAASLICVGLAA